MNSKQTNIAILGGGCSGLSLAWELSKSKTDFKCTIFEKRPNYTNDRTWCFWLANNGSFEHQDIISKSWSKWSFSYQGDQSSYTHASKLYSYNLIRAEDFYKKILDQISHDPRFIIKLNCEVDITSEDYAYVIDTRPLPTTWLIENTRIFQIFYGFKVKTPSHQFDKTRVALMEELNSNPEQSEFIYLLPFDNKHALVEFTLFSKKYTTPDSLIKPLKTYLDKLELDYEIIEKEHHVLPMGFRKPNKTTKNVVYGGIKANNLKSISGYGFLRSVKWAQNTAKMIQQQNSIKQINQSNSKLLKDNFMDKIFLNVLSHSMIDASRIFVSIGKDMPSDSFARFMSDEASFLDKVKLIYAVPKKPFLMNVFAND